jgi:AcrR family transcriptional regulator
MATADTHGSRNRDEGLRERKKRAMRKAIAEAAMKLFRARGFDAVTVADVARAANVSEKTVFNYFPTKEHLFFHRGIEQRAALLEAIRTRPPGASVVQPFRDATMEFIDTVERGPVESIVANPRLVSQSPTLRDGLWLAWEQEAALFAPVIAAEAGHSHDGLVPEVVARTLAWTHRLVFRAAFRRLLAGEDQQTVAAELRKQARQAYDLLERGLGGYGVKRR